MRGRIFLKLLVLGMVSMVLMMVLSSIKGLAHERKDRMLEVQRDIAGSYAGSQRIAGPVFVVSYREFWPERLYNKEKDTWYDKEINKLETSLFYPETLSYEGSMSVQERYRGIFKANVFQSEGRLHGQVLFPTIETLRSKQDSRIELVSAHACFLISDLRGITHVPEFKWNDSILEVASGSDLDEAGEGIHAKLPDVAALFGGVFNFEVNMDIHGMGQLEFVPLGAENQVRLASEWPHPSFIGDFLASERSVSEEGFTAEWNVNGLACSARQELDSGGDGYIQRLGVNLIDPVNIYPLTDRALKYGFLFIFITFSAFFLFEMLAGLKIHPIQYGFVGLAQALFFLLLLSLSEHIGFGLSYLIASAATIDVVTIYLCSVLKGFRRGVFFGGVLAVLYGALYALHQSEDHALLAGSTLLFGLMALVMMLTRKLDWYALADRQGE